MLETLNYVVHAGVHHCLAATPTSVYAPLYSAFVCGVDLPAGSAKQLFVDTGLIHLMVVSGSHLIFFERLLVWLPAPLRLGILGVYCWLTDFGAPVVRAFTRRLCAGALHDWGWSALQIEAAATVLVLSVYPPWLLSRSFLMSWLCAVALQAPLPWPRWPELNLSLKCYLFLFPFCAASPLSIGWNCLAGPLIGELLFPACLLAFACPWLTPLADLVWEALLWLLHSGPQAPPAVFWWPSHWLWWLPLTIHLGLLWGEREWRRAVAFSFRP